MSPAPYLPPIACPGCGGEVGRSGDALDCGRCGRVGRVRREVCDFVLGPDYAASFATEWKRFSATQLDSRNGTTISSDQFALITGWDDLRGKVTLDAGCGAGRYAEVAVSLGARLVAMDLSEAAYVARGNIPSDVECSVVRGSLLEPPLREAAFDRVYCIGVLQHTPDPLLAAKQLVRLLAPGGELALWMYGRSWYTGLTPKMLMRRVSRWLPPWSLEPIASGLVRGFTPVARAIGALPAGRLRRVARAGLPIASYWGDLPLTPEQHHQWSLLDTYDWLSPAYDLPKTFDEVARALADAGAQNVTRVDMPGLAIRARRGAAPPQRET